MKFVVVLIFSLFACKSFAQDKIGNGGGVWACVEPDQSISSGMLVDLFEARNEFGLNTPSLQGSDPLKLAQDKADFLATQWPARGAAWATILANTLQRIHFVNSDLIVVDDALVRTKPQASQGCAQGWQYVQFANFTNQGSVLIRQDIWSGDKIPVLDKTALIWHEVIYRWLRETQGDKNSVRARMIVGLLFSDLSLDEVKTRIEKVLIPPPPPAPTISLNLLTVANGQILSGSVMMLFSVQASLATQPIVYVYVDNAYCLAMLSMAPYQYNLDTKRLPNGRHVLYGTVYSPTSGTGNSNQVTVYVKN